MDKVLENGEECVKPQTNKQKVRMSHVEVLAYVKKKKPRNKDNGSFFCLYFPL